MQQNQENNVWTKWEDQQREIRKKNQTEILELKNTVNEMKTASDSINMRLRQAEESICELEDTSFEII